MTDNNYQCDWPDCKDDGEYRAPRSRDNIKSYRWFCLAHIRAYNKSWNYYVGMSEDDVEKDVREDTVWQRPSWPMSAARLAYAFDPHVAFDDFDLNDTKKQQPQRPKAFSPEGKAMALLDLSPPITVTIVKARYKKLVKRYHPDANGGNKQAEEKFKQINHAYETVMTSLNIS